MGNGGRAFPYSASSIDAGRPQLRAEMLGVASGCSALPEGGGEAPPVVIRETAVPDHRRHSRGVERGAAAAKDPERCEPVLALARMQDVAPTSLGRPTPAATAGA